MTIAWRSMILIALTLALAASAAWAVAPADRGEIESLFEEGQSAFKDGLTQRDTDPAAAVQSFDRAASLWQSIVDDHGIHNGRLLYNIGNARLLAGRVGPSILAYRRAERYISGDPHLVANLQQARRRVLTHVEPQPARKLRSALLFWHDGWTTRTRLLLFVVLSGGCCLWGLARLSARLNPWPRWPGWAAGALACVMAASLAVEQRAAGTRVEGVIVRDVVGRKGPSEAGYEPSFTEPLAQGVEFTVAEDRQDWILVRLADDRETWLPRDVVGLVN